MDEKMIQAHLMDRSSKEWRCENGASLHREKKQRDRYQCQRCNRSFSAMSGMPFAGSPLDFRLWLLLILLLHRHPKVTSVAAARTLCVRQATAWHMMKRIRKLPPGLNKKKISEWFSARQIEFLELFRNEEKYFLYEVHKELMEEEKEKREEEKMAQQQREEEKLYRREVARQRELPLVFPPVKHRRRAEH